MLIVYVGHAGSGKTHKIYDMYSVIRVNRENRSLSYLLLDSVSNDGRERCAWVDCAKNRPTVDEWKLWMYWADRTDMPIVIETRSIRGIPETGRLIEVSANRDDILGYARLHNHADPEFVVSEARGNWWRVKSLVHGNLQRKNIIFRGFGEWSDPMSVFAQKSLDQRLIRIVLGSVRQFPKHYLVIKAINETARQQGVTPEMLRPLINVLPRRKLVKQWAIPYTQRDGTGFMRWLHSVGLTRESYYASLEFEIDTQYQLARELQKSPLWRTGWKSLKKTVPDVLSIEDIMSVVFQVPMDSLRDDLDIRVII